MIKGGAMTIFLKNYSGYNVVEQIEEVDWSSFHLKQERQLVKNLTRIRSIFVRMLRIKRARLLIPKTEPCTWESVQ